MRKPKSARLHIAGVAVLAIIVAACAATQKAEVRQDPQQATPTPSPTPQEIKKDVPYVPTPQNVVASSCFKNRFSIDMAGSAQAMRVEMVGPMFRESGVKPALTALE